MKILVTGAFGNIGAHLIQELIPRGHEIACFDLKTKANMKAAKKFGDKVKCFWGDICDPSTITPAIQGQDLVIHMAAIIPPRTNKEPEYAQQVNVGGTQNLLGLLEQTNPRPRILFTSSMGVFGDKFDLPPPRKVTDPLDPVDTYSLSKAESEQLVRNSKLDWVVFRLGNAPPIKMGNMDPMMFQIALDTRMEFVHPADVAKAIANAAPRTDISGKIFLIGGGGKACQIRYKDFVGGLLDTIGIGAMPDAAFGSKHFYTDWLDTEESQRLFQYQSLTFEDWLRQVKQAFGAKKIFIKMLRPLIRKMLLKTSPNWEQINSQV